MASAAPRCGCAAAPPAAARAPGAAHAQAQPGDDGGRFCSLGTGATADAAGCCACWRHAREATKRLRLQFGPMLLSARVRLPDAADGPGLRELFTPSWLQPSSSSGSAQFVRVPRRRSSTFRFSQNPANLTQHGRGTRIYNCRRDDWLRHHRRRQPCKAFCQPAPCPSCGAARWQWCRREHSRRDVLPAHTAGADGARLRLKLRQPPW